MVKVLEHKPGLLKNLVIIMLPTDIGLLALDTAVVRYEPMNSYFKISVLIFFYFFYLLLLSARLFGLDSWRSLKT